MSLAGAGRAGTYAALEVCVFRIADVLKKLKMGMRAVSAINCVAF